MQKILILVDYFLPGYKGGGPIQSTANLIQAMKGEYEFAVISRDTDFQESEPYPDVVSNQWIEKDGYKVWYASEDWLSYKSLKELIVAEGCDFLYMNSMFSLPFTIFPLMMFRGKKAPFRMVLAPRGMLQAGSVNRKFLKKKVFLTLVKWSGVHKQITWQATDAQEKLDIEKFFGKGLDIRLVPNSPKQFQLKWQSTPKEKGKAKFVFISRVAPKKNLVFLIEQMQHIQGEAVLDVYGPLEEMDYWEKCQQIAAKLPAGVSVRHAGLIPNPEVPYKLQAYHFFAMSTLGENFGHAIFESFLAGKPVLISDKTPWRQLEGQQIGWDIELENEDKWRQVLQSCVNMDQQAYDKWSKAAWKYAEAYRKREEIVRENRRLFS